MIVAQKPTQSLAAPHWPLALTIRRPRKQQDVALHLVIPLGMETLDIVAQRPPQRPLTFVGGLTLAGVTAPTLIDQPMDGEIFLAWCEQMLAPALRPDVIVVMDKSAGPQSRWHPKSHANVRSGSNATSRFRRRCRPNPQ
jgi:hypothetical protein